MADTEVLFYIIIVVVILIKLVFWCIYLCLKNRRLRKLRQRQAEAEVRAANDVLCYEENPAIPQPAYRFTGFSLSLPYTPLTESLPEYQTEDPYKIDQPPPSYIDTCDEAIAGGTEIDSSRQISQELTCFANEVTSDTERLINDEDQNGMVNG